MSRLFFHLLAVVSTIACLAFIPITSFADENLLGYNKGAETLPKGAREIYQIFTSRNDKGQGTYHALDSETEIEYGVTDRFSVSGSIDAQSIETRGLLIDAYIPQDEKYSLRPSGISAAMKYNFLSPVIDVVGLSTYFNLEYKWLDRHSGQKKDNLSAKLLFLAQKYFMDGELIWVANLGMESTYAKRAPINNLPDGFEWPTDPEMEIEVIAGTGLSYRFRPNWFVGGETLYESEYETRVGQERWSLFVGPSLHYGGESWWSTLTYFHQASGGGEKYDGQAETNLHLIEKTKYEVRFKLGFNF